MQLTQTQIEAINKECPYGQGIFREPFGIPDHIKDLLIYTKWESGGRPGSCWDDENTVNEEYYRSCLLYTSPSPRDGLLSRMPSSA